MKQLERAIEQERDFRGTNHSIWKKLRNRKAI